MKKESPLRGKKVVVEERVDGSLLVISKGVSLKYKEITARPQKEVAPKPIFREFNRPPKPRKDHPWRARWKIDNPSKHSAIAY